MRKVFLLQRPQNEVGLEIDFDLDTPEPLDDAQKMIKSDEEDSYLCYYSMSSQPLIEWLMLLNDFVVVTDTTFVIANPFPARLSFPTIDIREVIALKREATKADVREAEPDSSFSNLDEGEVEVADE